MKNLFLMTMASFFLFFSSPAVNAQGRFGADSANCIKYLSYYKEYYKQKNYDRATINWRKAFQSCPPTASQNMLIDGTNLLRKLIVKNSANPQYKKALIDSLLRLHDIRAQYFPKYANRSMNNKGLDMITYMQNDNQALYKGLGDIIKNVKSDVKGAILLLDLKAAIELYKAGVLQGEDVLNTYQSNMGLLSEIIQRDNDEMDKKIKDEMESLFVSSKVASCDKLIQLFTPKYQADSSNLELVTNIVRMLSSAEDCTDNSLFYNAATSMYRLKPSAQAAYFLFKLNANRNNVAQATKYLEEAIASPDLAQSDLTQYTYELAAFCLKNNNYAKAYEAAQKLLTLDPSFKGKAYLLMASIWASAKCTGNEIAKRAKYWVAVDYLQKAMAADPSLSDECKSTIRQYSVYYPSAADAFMYNLTDGNSYVISCDGLRATTKVRTQK